MYLKMDPTLVPLALLDLAGVSLMNKRNNQTDPPKPMRIYEVEAEIGSEPLTQPFITNALVACDAGCFLLAWLLVVPIESITRGRKNHKERCNRSYHFN